MVLWALLLLLAPLPALLHLLLPTPSQPDTPCESLLSGNIADLPRTLL
jgi:hypothetical protein